MLKLLNFKQKATVNYLLILFVSSLVLFFPVLSTYFSGDDFFHFKVSQTDGSLIGFIKLFGLHPFSERGIAFYRPLLREALFNVFYSLFGLNHLPFRILQFALHFINITLVFVFFKKLFQNKLVPILASFFFALNAANIGSLYYLAAGVYSQGVLIFVLLCLISFWNGKKLLAFIFFILGLMTDELVIATPALLLGIVWVQRKSKIVLTKEYIFKLLKGIGIYILLTGIFLYAVIFIIGTSQSEVEYQINLNPKTLVNTFSWYVVWSVGIPEMLVDFLGSGLKLNPDLMKNWGNYFKLIFPSFILFILTLTCLWFDRVRKKEIFTDKRFWFLVGWFVVGIFPVLFWPIHKKTVYLQVSLPAICGIFAYLLSKSKKVIVFLSITTFLILNITTIMLAHKTYWSAQRGKVAQKLITDMKNQYPSIPVGSTIFIKNDPNYPFISREWGGTSTQAYFVLNGEDALQLLYKDPTIKVLYEDRNEAQENSLEFTAYIN